MIIEGEAPEALSNDDIITRYGSAINQLIQASLDPQYDFERQLLVTQARRIWQFIKGQHYGIPGLVSTPYGDTTDFVPYDFFSSNGDGNQETGPEIRLCPPVNVLGGDCFKFMAVMGQAAPRVKAVPDDPRDGDSIEAAHNADVNVRDLWLKNEVDKQWKALAFHQYATGPVFIRGEWNCDGTKYGWREEPQIEVKDGDDGSPIPVVTGTQRYANGDAVMSLHSILEMAIPYEAKTIQECNVMRLERMVSKWWLLSAFKGENGKPSRLEKYRTGDVPDDDFNSSSSTAAEARDAVVTPSGTGRVKKPNYWRFTEYWLQPHMFESIIDPEARQIFQEHFTDGIYVARVGDITVKVLNQAATKEWAICRVGRSPHIMERPIAADVLPLNRAIDDLFGMAIETVLRAITQTIMDAQLIDREAMNTKEAIPAEIILTQIPVDGDISKRIYQIPPARLSDQVIPLLSLIRTYMQDISGIRPEIAGGGEVTTTYREAKQRRDQALLQLAPQAAEQRFAAEGIASILVKLRAEYGIGTVKASRKGAYGTVTDVADMADLKSDNWHMEADDNFPMTLADRRDQLFSILKEFPPEVQQALSVLDPINIEQVCDLIQIPELESAVREQKEKTLQDIEALLKEQPMPSQNPGDPPQPSQPPDSYDAHVIVSNVMAAWCRSETGQKTKASNPAGFANVVARQAAEQQMAQPPTPPPTPPLRGSVAWSGKLEDFPNLVPEILKGEGLDMPQAPVPQMGSPAQPPPSGDFQMPGSAGNGSAPTPQDALPPLPPEGPQGATGPGSIQ